MNKELIFSDLSKYNQNSMINHLNSLSSSEQEELMTQIEGIDWSFMDYLNHPEKKGGDIGPISALSIDSIKNQFEYYESIGVESIKNGELCLLLLAGGQGTRLGYDMPKGTFNIGITKDLYIFQLLIEHTLDVVKLSDTWIHMYIMCSDINHDATVSFFEEHNYFGYNKDFLHFFVQELNPATDFDGNLLLTSKTSLAMSPNGNGGWFSSLKRCGLLDKILDSNLKWINVFSVDNVLQRIADPVFLGATIDSGKMCGSKVVYKASPEEKVGAICTENGKPHIIEYYELSKEMMYQVL